MNHRSLKYTKVKYIIKTDINIVKTLKMCCLLLNKVVRISKIINVQYATANNYNNIVRKEIFRSIYVSMWMLSDVLEFKKYVYEIIR